MDRVLELNEAIAISLAGAEIRVAMPAGDEGEAYLIQQLSAGVWGYILDGKLCLVSRSLTALASLEPDRGVLQVESIAATEQRDVTAAFKDGHKIVAEWIPAGQKPSGSGNGASLLWTKLSGEEPADVGPQPLTTNQAANRAVSMEGLENGDRQAADATPILPQNEIDRLIAAMRGEQATLPQAPITTDAFTTETEMDMNQAFPPLSPAATPAAGDTPLNPLGSLPAEDTGDKTVPITTDTSAAEPDMHQPLPPLSPATPAAAGDTASNWLNTLPAMNIADAPSTIPTDTSATETDLNQPLPPLSFESPATAGEMASNWLNTNTLPAWNTPNAPAPGVEKVGDGGWVDTPGRETLPGFDAGVKIPAVAGRGFLDLISGHIYAVAIFERREEFERALETARQGFNGSLIALWEKQGVHTHLTAGLQRQLQTYQLKYRSAAAKLQKELTQLRQLEQIVPNLQTNQQQRSKLSAEAARITEQMQAIRWRMIVQNHDGRCIARKIFDLEAKRRVALDKLAACTHRMLRRSKSGGSLLIRTRARFLSLQRQLEGCFERLANLEKEIERRLEYQAEWQALVKQKASLERELAEIEKYLKSITIGAMGDGLVDAKVAQKWLESELKTARSRERFLLAWQDCLVEEKGWIVRPLHEPMLVLGDTSTMGLTGVGRGAFFVLVAGEHAEAMPKAPDDCEAWVATDASFEVISSGTGLGCMDDPVAAAIRNLAGEMGLDMEKALQTLDLADQVGEMENQGGYFNVL